MFIFSDLDFRRALGGRTGIRFGSSLSGFYYYKLFILLNKTNIVDI
jgi:hypothetical protein